MKGGYNLGQGFGLQGPGGVMGAGEDSGLGEGDRRGCRVWERVVTSRRWGEGDTEGLGGDLRQEGLVTWGR